MNLKLYLSSKKQPISDPHNDGFDHVINLLTLLEKKGISSEVMDMASLADDVVQKAYLDAIVPSVYKRFGIRRAFGSRRRSGWLFGKEVPALLVYQEGQQYPIDVYPHEEQGGRVRTIREFLQNLSNEVE